MPARNDYRLIVRPRPAQDTPKRSLSSAHRSMWWFFSCGWRSSALRWSGPLSPPSPARAQRVRKQEQVSVYRQHGGGRGRPEGRWRVESIQRRPCACVRLVESTKGAVFPLFCVCGFPQLLHACTPSSGRHHEPRSPPKCTPMHCTYLPYRYM